MKANDCFLFIDIISELKHCSPKLMHTDSCLTFLFVNPIGKKLLYLMVDNSTYLHIPNLAFKHSLTSPSGVITFF